MYIKTENGRGDDELDNRHGYRKGRDGDIHNRRTGSRSQVSGSRDYKRNSDYKKKSDGYKKGGFDKLNHRNGTNNHRDNRKPYIDPAKLAGLSYEERMKLYKDAYGKKDSYKKNNYNKKPYKKGAPANKAAAAPAKKSIWQKIKAFFGR
jgi:ATP-dependent RNA helicase RhlB